MYGYTFVIVPCVHSTTISVPTVIPFDTIGTLTLLPIQDTTPGIEQRPGRRRVARAGEVDDVRLLGVGQGLGPFAIELAPLRDLGLRHADHCTDVAPWDTGGILAYAPTDIGTTTNGEADAGQPRIAYRVAAHRPKAA